MIQHDAANFPGLKLINHSQIGCAEFKKGKERLTLLNVNRMPLEQTLGVDLIYYQHQYRSYILIQYKRMSQNQVGGWEFRPDKQYQKELDLMRDFKTKNPQYRAGRVLADYRLSPEAFYFKLCKSVTFTPMDTNLIEGMYVPLDYWELVLKAPAIVGPKKGLRINYSNIERHLNNWEFVNLARFGWIGSHVANTDTLSALINAHLKKGHSVLVGLER